MQDKGKQRQINNFEPSQEDHGISTQDLGGSLYNLGMLCSYNVGSFLCM
jgi:hypothetical protein